MTNSRDFDDELATAPALLQDTAADGSRPAMDIGPKEAEPNDPEATSDIAIDASVSEAEGSAPDAEETAEPLFDQFLPGVPHASGVFLNSIPKAGTVLLQRILMEFIVRGAVIDEPWMTVETISHGRFRNVSHRFFVGHLYFTPHSWAKLKNVRQVLLVRDPVDVCLSYAKFYASAEMASRSELSLLIKNQQPEFGAVLRWLLTGWHVRSEEHPSLVDEWRLIAMWSGLKNVFTVTYEGLRARVRELESRETEDFMRRMLAHAGIDINNFPDWRERVERGANPEGSSTYSGNLETLIPLDGVPTEADRVFLSEHYRELQAHYQRLFLS